MKTIKLKEGEGFRVIIESNYIKYDKVHIPDPSTYEYTCERGPELHKSNVKMDINIIDYDRYVEMREGAKQFQDLYDSWAE